MYDPSKEGKSDFTYVKGLESHLLRRKMILDKYPQIAKLLVPNKLTTIYITLALVLFMILNCYWAKVTLSMIQDQSIWVLLLDAYLIGGLVNHTLHCCIHDFTHFGGHTNMTVNKVMAVICNIPMAIPSALSFGRYHSDHHNFLGELEGDPDLPLLWESKLSYKFKWYKYVFYSVIELFYALRPVFMKNPSISLEEALNYIFIVFTNLAVYHYWGPYALLFFFIGGLSSIGPHPAAIHIIAEHYEFIEGQ
jgi:sphingolipid 4-desaturase/C4-monooxygenase